MKRKIFVAPDVSVPRDIMRRSKEPKYEDMSSSSSTMQKRPSLVGDNNSNTRSSKEEIRDMMSKIKVFNANSLTGSMKKNYKDDILTKLGAPPPKQPTMPFKLKMDILAGRKKRKLLKEKEVKESGVVLANKHNRVMHSSKKSKKPKKK